LREGMAEKAVAVQKEALKYDGLDNAVKTVIEAAGK
jgi:hypothetical protein